MNERYIKAIERTGRMLKVTWKVHTELAPPSPLIDLSLLGESIARKLKGIPEEVWVDVVEEIYDPTPETIAAYRTLLLS